MDMMYDNVVIVVLYDLDMTLFDTHETHEYFERKILDRYGIDSEIYDKNRKYFDKTIIDCGYDKTGISQLKKEKNKLIRDFIDGKRNGKLDSDGRRHYDEIMSMVTMYDYVLETWDALWKRGSIVAICTNAHQIYLDAICDHNETFGNYVSDHDIITVTADDFNNGKPHHEPIEVAMNKVRDQRKLDENQLIVAYYIGDKDTDMKCVDNANKELKWCKIYGGLFDPYGSLTDGTEKKIDGCSFIINNHPEILKKIQCEDNNRDYTSVSGRFLDAKNGI